MKIAVWHNLPSGGGKRALYDHVKGLLDRGHQVESWCPPTADQRFLPLGDLVTENVVPLEIFTGRIRGPAARLRGFGSLIPALVGASDAHCRICARDIDAGGFDVVLAGSSQLFAVTGLARHLQTPSALFLGEPARFLYEASPRLPWPALPKSGRVSPTSRLDRIRDSARVHALRIQAREELLGALAYDRVLANSLFSRESMLRAYGIEARVCYVGVDVDRFSHLGLERKGFVVGVGEIYPHKRVEQVVEAISKLASPRPELKWIANKAEKNYLASLNELADQRKVTFTPMVSLSDSEVIRVLNEASVLAYAPRLEPFGYAPIEAAACGLPVVAVAEGGIRESVIDGETGFLVEDASLLHEGISRVLDDPILAASLGRKARKNVESNWSLDSATSRLEANLTEVAGLRAVS